MQQKRKRKREREREREDKLTNSTKAWFRLAPTLHLVLTIFPKGLQSSISSSSVHSHGRFRRCKTFDGVCVYRNWGCPEVDIYSNSGFSSQRDGGRGGVWVSRNCWDFPGKYWGCVLESFKERLALMNFYVVRYNHGSPSNVADPAGVWFKIIFGPKLNWSNLKLKSNKKIV